MVMRSSSTKSTTSRNKGCAMGTKCSPSYANIFMGKFKETFINPKIQDKTRLYLRYITAIPTVYYRYTYGILPTYSSSGRAQERNSKNV